MIFGTIAIVFAATFLALLILLHFLKPELDPSWRMISEYEIGRFGWMMRVAFFCWGASVAALLVTIWPSLQSASGTISRWWLIVIAIAQIGAGIYKTNPITDTSPNPANTIHALCGAIVILTFPIVATLTVHSLLLNSGWSAAQSQLIFGVALAWLGVAAFFASIIVSRRLDSSAGSVGPKVYLGWPNRFMVVTYALWIIIVAGNALRFL